MNSGPVVDKSGVITWVATLSIDDPRLATIDKIRRGEKIQPEEALVSLKQLAVAVSKDQSWLSRLGVQEKCGHRLAGSLRYKSSEVCEYLASEECRARIAELRELRRKKKA